MVTMKSIILFLIIGLAHVQSVVAQDDQSVVGANEYLTSQTENTDKDVTEINTLDFLTQTKVDASRAYPSQHQLIMFRPPRMVFRRSSLLWESRHLLHRGPLKRAIKEKRRTSRTRFPK